VSNFARIAIPQLTLEKPGMRLEYDGWRDRVSGAVRGSHSNQKEARWYRFTCGWAQGQAGEIVEFEIAAKHQHPDNWIKGTAPENRKDVRDVARRVSRLWRDEKLKEQEQLRQATRDPAAVQISVKTDMFSGIRTEAWWIGGAVLVERDRFLPNCREGWIEVLPIGDSDQEVAEYVAQIYADGGDVELALKAAQAGLCLSDVKRVITAKQEGDWRDAERLIDEIVRSHGSSNGHDS
jgi:hypothetical protein